MRDRERASHRAIRPQARYPFWCPGSSSRQVSFVGKYREKRQVFFCGKIYRNFDTFLFDLLITFRETVETTIESQEINVPTTFVC